MADYIFKDSLCLTLFHPPSPTSLYVRFISNLHHLFYPSDKHHEGIPLRHHHSHLTIASQMPQTTC